MFLQKKYLGDFGADFFRCTDMKGGGGLWTLPRFCHAIAPRGVGVGRTTKLAVARLCALVSIGWRRYPRLDEKTIRAAHKLGTLADRRGLAIRAHRTRATAPDAE